VTADQKHQDLECINMFMKINSSEEIIIHYAITILVKLLNIWH